MTATDTQAPVQEGEILDGKYRVDRVLGAGGMGVVVAATHVQLNTKVALKFLLPEVLNEPKVVERFVREARSAVQIQSEHVARVADVGALPSGSPYMVMEFLEGHDLAEHLAKHGPLGISQAVGYVLQACEAIAEAHSLGIVHRDLKPANLFLTQRQRREPIIKVLDFGISKSKDASALNLTQTSSMMGSPYYMSPEQMKSSRDVDPRSDIWALGIIMFELLTGTPPFEGTTITELVVAVTTGKLPPLRAQRPEVPEGLARVVERCLERDPDRRYADVGALAKALAPFGPARSDVSVERISRILGEASIQPPANQTGRGAGPDASGATMQATASTWAHSQTMVGTKRRGLWVIAIAMLVAGAASVAVWQWSGSRSATGSATATAPQASNSVVTASPDVRTVVPSAPAPSTPASAVPLASSEAAAAASAPSVTSAQPASAALAASAKPAAARAPERAKAAAKVSAPAPATPAPASRGLNMGMKE